MHQDQFYPLFARIAAALERQSVAWEQLGDEIFEARGGQWYLTPEGKNGLKTWKQKDAHPIRLLINILLKSHPSSYD